MGFKQRQTVEKSWSIKHLLTKGIQEELGARLVGFLPGNSYIADGADLPEDARLCLKPRNSCRLLRLGTEIFLTREEAVVAANKVLARKIASVKKSLKKLESMKF